MSQEETFKILKELIVQLSESSNPANSKEISKLKSILDESIKPDSPLSVLGWDSMQMTFLLVAVEDRFNIDTSTISILDLFTVGDFLTDIQKLVNQK
jgi:acyl carrier protein